MIFRSALKPGDGKNVNHIATAIIPQLLFTTKNYARNVFSGFWIGTPEQLAAFNFNENTPSLTSTYKVAIGRAVLVRERKTKDGAWELCDCEKEPWITEHIIIF